MLGVSRKTEVIGKLISKAWPFGNKQRLIYWSGVLGKFVGVQLIVQCIGFVNGLLMVRWLSRPEMAFFTIANSMQATMNVLADTGASVALLSVGGQVCHDRIRFGSLINAAIKIRTWLALAACLVVTPILVWMLQKSGSSVANTSALVFFVLLSFSAQIMVGILSIVPKLTTQWSRVQKFDLFSALSRLVLILGAAFVAINALVAVAITSVVALGQQSLLRRWCADSIDFRAKPLSEDVAAMVSAVKKMAPNTIFFCVQGQVTVWLISVFGNTANIATIGALARVVVVFTVVNSVLGSVVTPVFARCQEKAELAKKYWFVLACYFAMGLALIGGCVLFPKQVLWVLGPKYADHSSELVLMVISNVAFSFIAAMWQLNTAKGWIHYSWLYIPTTVVIQILLLVLLDIRSVQGVLYFSIFSNLGPLLVNIVLSWHGFRTMKEVRANPPAGVSAG
jgi:O-antigen/teichoic acid export membrane protein